MGELLPVLAITNAADAQLGPKRGIVRQDFRQRIDSVLYQSDCCPCIKSHKCIHDQMGANYALTK
jgi:hypothetical protein